MYLLGLPGERPHVRTKNYFFTKTSKVNQPSNTSATDTSRNFERKSFVFKQLEFRVASLGILIDRFPTVFV